MKILWTGAAGFIAGYTVEELLNNGHEVVGVDNFSKYGKVEKSYDNHPNYTFIEGDAKDIELMKQAAEDVDVIVSGAAMIGGISYFHEYAYQLLAENERITAAAFDTAIWAHKERKLKKILVMSSSMVYESTTQFPTPETAVREFPPPLSTYGFQKLATEYFAQGAWEQHELHILGEGNQIRHYTYGGDLARGIRLCIEKEEALNQDFNISTPRSTTVLELAELIWKKINSDKPFKYVSDPGFEYDVQKRVPDTAKAEKMLGYKAETSLEDMLDEVIPWIKEQVEHGNI
jgi:UDP-glucose 4-epimerase